LTKKLKIHKQSFVETFVIGKTYFQTGNTWNLILLINHFKLKTQSALNNQKPHTNLDKIVFDKKNKID
jgi:hypothetical protein